MIPVTPAEEPLNFDAQVRQPGLRAIAELVGETPPRTAGQRFAQVAEAREEIPPNAFPPYWRQALDDLLTGYNRICSYLCLLYSSRHGSGQRRSHGRQVHAVGSGL